MDFNHLPVLFLVRIWRIWKTNLGGSESTRHHSKAVQISFGSKYFINTCTLHYIVWWNQNVSLAHCRVFDRKWIVILMEPEDKLLLSYRILIESGDPHRSHMNAFTILHQKYGCSWNLFINYYPVVIMNSYYTSIHSSLESRDASVVASTYFSYESSLPLLSNIHIYTDISQCARYNGRKKPICR